MILYTAIGGFSAVVIMVTFLFDSVFTWVIVVPVAFVLAKYTALGIVAVYFLVQATELIQKSLTQRAFR